MSPTDLALQKAICDLQNRLVPNGVFHEVAVNPRPNAIESGCFQNVELQIQEFGGSACFGWRFETWCPLLVEAEYHAVWRDPDGSFLDVTPNIMLEAEIIFLPDLNRVYEGRQVNAARQPAQNHPVIHQYIKACDDEFEFQNRGEGAYQTGEIEIAPEEEREYRQIIARKESALMKLMELSE